MLWSAETVRSRIGSPSPNAPALMVTGRTSLGLRCVAMRIVRRPAQVTGFASPEIVVTRSPSARFSTSANPAGVVMRVPETKQDTAVPLGAV